MTKPLIQLSTLALALAWGNAQATLGEPVQNLPSEAHALAARSYAAAPASITVSGSVFTRHGLELDSGGRITQFSDSNGMVFAVSWSAPTMPDLDALLGAHKISMDQAQAERQRLVRSPRNFSAGRGDLISVSNGHLRAYKGYAYLQSIMPKSFDLKELSK